MRLWEVLGAGEGKLFTIAALNYELQTFMKRT